MKLGDKGEQNIEPLKRVQCFEQLFNPFQGLVFSDYLSAPNCIEGQ
jgi:hypothetical protein